MNEIRVIRLALNLAKSSSEAAPFGQVLQKAMADESGGEGVSFGRLFTAIAAVRVEVIQRYESGALKTIALKNLDGIEELFDGKSISRPAREMARRSASIEHYLDGLVAFEHLEELGAKLPQSKEQMFKEIKEVLLRCKEAPNIDQSVKQLVESNFELLQSAVNSLEQIGRGTFRGQALTAVGVLSLELKNPSISEKTREFLTGATDAALRVAGLVEIAGKVSGLLGYTGGVAGLLTGPDTEADTA